MNAYFHPHVTRGRTTFPECQSSQHANFPTRPLDYHRLTHQMPATCVPCAPASVTMDTTPPSS